MEKMTIELHKYQDEAIFSPERFVAAISGIQGGKTFAGCVWSRMQYDEFPQDAGLIAAPTYKILDQSTLPKFFSINKDLKKYYKKGSSIIEQPGRGPIYIRSTEDPNSIEGMTLRWAWYDEGGMMKADAWINVQGRLSILQGKLFITTTPYFFNWLATDFYDKYKKGNKDYKVVQFRSLDNPYFPKEEFERARKTMDPRIFQRRYLGIFTKMEGLVYPGFEYGRHTFEELPTGMVFDQVIVGLDWGYENPAAALVIGVKDNIYYILDELYETHLLTSDIKERVLQFAEKYGVERVYADSAEPDRIAAFNTPPRIYTLPAYKDMEFGLNKVNEILNEGRLRIHRGCVHVLDEIERYHFPELKEGSNAAEKPVKFDDHAMDALRYALASYQPRTASMLRMTNKRKSTINDAFRIKRAKKKSSGYNMRMA